MTAALASRAGFVFVELGSMSLGIATTDLVRIRDRLDTDLPEVDLDTVFGAPDFVSPRPRFLELTNGRSVATRADVVVAEASDTVFHAVPEFLLGWASRSGVTAIAEHGEGYGMLLDSGRFLDRVHEFSEAEGRT